MGTFRGLGSSYRKRHKENKMRSRDLFTVLILLLVVASLAIGCTQAFTDPTITPLPSPTATVGTVLPQQAKPSQDESPLPPPENKGTTEQTSPLATPVPTAKLPVQSTVSVPSKAIKVVELAKADLAERFAVTTNQIQVVSVQSTEWTDTSLGCPQPGMVYAQVITPGFQILLEINRETYAYHTDQGQNVVLCEKESTMDIPTTTGPVEAGLEQPLNLAKEDLAQRLSVAVDQIEVLEAKSVVWPDASLGCPLPEMRYKQVPQDGTLIRLSIEGQVYEYHSGGSRGPFLCEQTIPLKETSIPTELTSPPEAEDK
jgi:hypothetical protein